MSSINRRDFINKSAMGGLALSIDPKHILFEAGKNQLNEIGIIYGNTMGPEIKKDYKKALEKIASCGYKTLEFSDHLGNSAVEYKEFLKSLGLRPLIEGCVMADLQNKIHSVIETAHLFEKPYVTCYWPWMDGGKDKTLDDYKRVSEQFNIYGEKFKTNGLKLAYHNHNLEFIITDGKIPYDILLANTDPSLVTMEIDLYWVVKGGQDPIRFFKSNPGRFDVFHVKDMDKTADKGFACVGDGIIDFASIFANKDLAGTKHFIVEHDEPKNPVECMESSFRYLKNLKF